MRVPVALETALTLIERPESVRSICQMPLPTGITLLLEVAAGNQTAVTSAQAMTRRSPDVLYSAAAFFIEQILFVQGADHYRVLGCSQTATRRQLRRHMALLVKWLHPDTHEPYAEKDCLDRSIFVHRVTHAWQDLKDSERYATYDRTLSETPSHDDTHFNLNGLATGRTGEQTTISFASSRMSQPPRFVAQQAEAATIFSRLVWCLRRQA